MYHTMYPPHILVHVGQQGHYDGHRQGRMPPTGNLPLNPFEQNGFMRRNDASFQYSAGDRRPMKSYSHEDVSRPRNETLRFEGPKSQHVLYGHSVYATQSVGSVELLQVLEIEMPQVRVNYGGHHPANGRNNNNGGNNNGLHWRDRNGIGGGGGSNSGPGMAPPSVPVGVRPLTNNMNMKRVFWGNKSSNSDLRRSAPFNHRGQNDRRRHNNRSPPSRIGNGNGGDGASSEAYSSDSGFSSRSPTPSGQQVSPTGTGTGTKGGSGDEESDLGAGEPSLHRLVKNEQAKVVKRLHEVSSAPPPNNQHLYQPFYPHYNHRNQAPPHQGSPHLGSPHHGISVHHLNHHSPHQSNQRRSESMTSLTQQPGPPTNGYQSKRRFHSGRHSPPASSGNRNGSRGRRMNAGYTIRTSLPSPNLPPCFIAPERFLARSRLMYVSERPAQLVMGDGWDELSEAIWDKFMQHQQTEETYRNKMMLWKCLYFYIKHTFPRYGLFLVGSTISGFGSNSSDMDMCLLVRHSEMDQRSEAVGYLEQVLRCLRHCDFVRDPELIQAKVPILKFCDTEHNLEVDLNCNNAVGIRNTHLLYCYSQMDWRVRPLVLVVKMWAAKQGINDAKNMTISSYSLVLMVISYLQCGVSPSVLPNLHALYPGKFIPESDLNSIDLHEELRPYTSNNTQSVGQLLLGFLEYYANFDYGQDAISVRQAKRVPIEECRHARSYKNDPHQWKCLCIEGPRLADSLYRSLSEPIGTHGWVSPLAAHAGRSGRVVYNWSGGIHSVSEPFDLTNTAHSVYDPEVFEKIKGVFHSSYHALKQSRDLSSIFETACSLNES